jgi:SAM-dependent methyltransferase
MLSQLSRRLRAYYRHKRYSHFWLAVGHFIATDAGLWLDLGGGPGSYFLEELSAARPVVLLDIQPSVLKQAQRAHPNVIGIVADGEHLPFADRSVRCIFCNSVIEHVGNPEALAREISRVGLSFFVQTPNGRFPLETHSWIPIPFYSILPEQLKRLACRALGASYEYIASVNYVPECRLRAIFPSARIVHERFLWLTKAFYMINRE